MQEEGIFFVVLWKNKYKVHVFLNSNTIFYCDWSDASANHEHFQR